MECAEIDAVLESAEKAMSQCCIMNGCHVQYADVGGQKVGTIRKAFKTFFNIPNGASALIKGERVDEDQVLLRGQTLEFVKESGQKSALSPEELEALELPKEVSTEEAGQILDCSKATVIKIANEGFLEWRNSAPASSQRPVFRFTLRSVLEYRTGYKRGEIKPPAAQPKVAVRRRVSTARPFRKHVRRKKQG